MTHGLSSFLLRAACLTAPVLVAQTLPPPPILVIAREEVKPGRGAAHAATEWAWSRLLAKAKIQDYYLGMTSLTGPSDALFVMGYESYQQMEKLQGELDKNPAIKKEVDKVAQQDGEHLSGARSLTAAYRKDLSYGPDVEIGKMRFFRIRTFRVKPGQTRSFEAGLKQALDAYGKVDWPGSFATFEVTAGQNSGTFLIIRPMASLAEMDGMAAKGKAFEEAMGADGMKALDKMTGEAVGSVDNQIYAFSPKLSYPGPKTVASDPKFWTPKPEKEASK